MNIFQDGIIGLKSSYVGACVASGSDKTVL